MSETCSHDCENCGQNPESCGEKVDFRQTLNELSQVKHVVGIVSGKGGVGKSMVTCMLAVLMSRAGYKVGIMDADITGPSIPQAFGLHEKALSQANCILPAETSTGIKVISLNLLLPHETDPVVWRGPIIASMVTQFWTDVIWGDLDYMFVDMPPGTGDVPLTIFQSLPLDGIVTVTSPQELVGMIVTKAVTMAGLMKIPVLGAVENMSYFECPQCHTRHELFGPSRIDAAAKAKKIDTVSKLPLDPKLAVAMDRGRIEEFSSEALDNLVAKLKKLPVKNA